MSKSEKQAIIYLTFLLGLADNYTRTFKDKLVPYVKTALEAYNVPFSGDGDALVLVSKKEQKVMESVFDAVEKNYADYKPNAIFVKLFINEVVRDILKHITDEKRIEVWVKFQTFISNEIRNKYDKAIEEHKMAMEVLTCLNKTIRDYL